MATTTEEMISALETYVLTRYIGIAQVLADEFKNEESKSPLQESGYAILSIVMSYFEMIESISSGCKSPNGQSKNYFIAGFKKVYPSWKTRDLEIGNIYKKARCGMYHRGMTKLGTRLSRNFTAGFDVVNKEVHINPSRVVDEMKVHFSDLVARLRDTNNQNERCQFGKFCVDTEWDVAVAEAVAIKSDPAWKSTTTSVVTTENPADSR